VLSHVEARGAEAVGATITDALGRNEPLLLALALPQPAPVVAPDAVPSSLRMLEIASGRAADYDALLLAAGDL